MTLDNYSKYLNPQNKILLEEYKRAIQNKMWLTTIILALTIIDNILSDEGGRFYQCQTRYMIINLDLNKFKKDSLIINAYFFLDDMFTKYFKFTIYNFIIYIFIYIIYLIRIHYI